MTQATRDGMTGPAIPSYPLSKLTRPLPSLAELQAFITAASLGSSSKAATHLCRTQGAISRQLQQLEEYYQCALFTRHSSGLTLTQEGEALLPVAIDVLTTLARHASQQHETASFITLRLPPTFAIRWLMPRLQQIKSALGTTELRIVTCAVDAPDFTGKDTDAHVVRGTGPWPGLQAIPLFTENFTPMCSPGLAASIKTIADLSQVNLLHPGENHAEWRCWLSRVGASQFDASLWLTFDTLELTYIAAEQGYGVAIGDPRFAQDRLKSGALLMPFREIVPNGASYFLLFPQARVTQPKIQALAEILVQLAQEDLL